jgi:hypothetical protein
VERRGDPGTGPPAVHFGVTLSAAGRPLATEASTRAATLSSTVHTTGQAGGDPVLHRPAVQLEGDPALRRPRVLRRRRLLLSTTVSAVSTLLMRDPPPCEEEEEKARPRRRRPNQLRVTLSLSAGQLIRRPPAPGRDQTLHQRPGTDFLRPHHAWGVRLTTGARRCR